MTATTAPPGASGPRPPVRRPRPEPVRRSAPRWSVDGTRQGTVELDPEWFGLMPNEAVLHQVVTAQRAAARAGTHATRTRAEVRGGGAKPYRQKGTGRARQGSIRATQWVGGGIALGPKPRSYRQRTPKKMVRAALLSALSDRAAGERVAVVDRWPWDAPRTKDARAALEAIGAGGRVLIVLGPDEWVARRSFANLPSVETVDGAELNAHDVVRCDWLVFSDATLPGASEVAGASSGDAAAGESSGDAAAGESSGDAESGA